jgi:hypothetical protein
MLSSESLRRKAIERRCRQGKGIVEINAQSTYSQCLLLRARFMHLGLKY